LTLLPTTHCALSRISSTTHAAVYWLLAFWFHQHAPPFAQCLPFWTRAAFGYALLARFACLDLRRSLSAVMRFRLLLKRRALRAPAAASRRTAFTCRTAPHLYSCAHALILFSADCGWTAPHDLYLYYFWMGSLPLTPVTHRLSAICRPYRTLTPRLDSLRIWTLHFLPAPHTFCVTLFVCTHRYIFLHLRCYFHASGFRTFHRLAFLLPTTFTHAPLSFVMVSHASPAAHTTLPFPRCYFFHAPHTLADV